MKRICITLIALITLCASAYAEPQRFANIVCFVKFADQKDNSWEHDFAYYDQLFNSTNDGAISVRNYFSDMSYGKMDWQSTIITTEYVDSHNSGYFKPKSDTNPEGYTSLELMLDTRFKTLVKNMCAYLSPLLPTNIQTDLNGDGIVDNVVMIINGNSDISASRMLWPANNISTSSEVTLGGNRVRNYLKVFDGANGYVSLVPSRLNCGVLAHEMMHTLNAFDLYTAKTSKLNPVGIWDLMSDNGRTPQSVSAYIRMRYGEAYGNWLPETSIETLTKEGEYTLNPINSTTENRVAYKIHPDMSRSEYFMLEYRPNTGTWDSQLPAGGLLVSRVNSDYKGNGGRDNAYEMYFFRPGGSLTEPGDIKGAPLGQMTGRTSFGTLSDTDYPYYEDGTRAKFAITNVREENGILNFTFFPEVKDTSSVNDIENSPLAGFDPHNLRPEDAVFNLQGVRLRHIPSSGTYIVNGRKLYLRL